MLMRDNKQAKTNETRTELRGISHPGWTLERNSANGMPLSRANAKSWREDVATLLTQLKIDMIIKTADRTLVPAADPVVLYRI